jgi:hypothetical protein
MNSQCTNLSEAYADKDHQIHPLQIIFTRNNYVNLAFSGIIHYGKDDPQTQRSLSAALHYLLDESVEAYKPQLELQNFVL